MGNSIWTFPLKGNVSEFFLSSIKEVYEIFRTLKKGIIKDTTSKVQKSIELTYRIWLIEALLKTFEVEALQTLLPLCRNTLFLQGKIYWQNKKAVKNNKHVHFVSQTTINSQEPKCRPI